MKKFLAGLAALGIITASVITGLSVHAASANLLANPSVEAGTATAPTSWSHDGWGTNNATFAYLNTGHTGTHSVQTTITSYTSGDAKWYPTTVTVKPNTSYTFSDWYISNATTEVDAAITNTSNKISYKWLADVPASSTWKQASYTFTTPAAASKMTIYHLIHSVGQLTSDDASLVDNSVTSPAPTAPTVAISAPTAASTVSGTVTVSANASDAVAVSNVQFKLDGNNLGSADTTAPYSVNWDTTTASNGTHTLTAVATNSSNLSTTSTSVTVTVNNQVVSTAPTVSISTPLNNTTINGTVSVGANANDAVGIASVQFKLDGNNLGSAVTTSPYSVNWDTKTASNGTHTLTAVATNLSNQSTTSTAVTVNVQNPTPPTVSLTAPAANATVSGTVSVTANATDTQGITSVQFKLDGNNLGSADTTTPYSVSWDTKTATNGTHTLTAVATNLANLSATSTSVTVTVNNPTAPTVAITAPAANATVSGSTSVTANASDAGSVTSVQFKLDGNNLGAADTTAPYSVNWDTTGVSNGTHTLTAVATNNSNLTTTSAPVTVTVSNTVTQPQNGPNLIANPSFESSANGTSPDSWLSSGWGTNTSTFTYLNTGAHTGSKAVEVQTTNYSNGAANWYYNDIPVTAGKTYQYTNWYKSNVDTEVDAEVVMSDGTTQYFWLGTVLANTNWTQFKTTFQPPAGAKSVAIYQLLAKNGYIISDDYSLNEYTPAPFNRAIVSVTFDDGWASQYTNAYPIIKQLGIPSTFYIISGSLTDQPDYMSGTQVKDLYANGNEIGSHTITHSDLTQQSQATVVQEMSQSQTTLQNLLGASVTDFAYPYGAYNAYTISVGQQYYASQRTVNAGLNTKDNLDVTQLKMYEVDSNISQAQVKGWIDAAIAQHAWLILTYHETAVNPVDPSDALYTTQPSDLSAEMNYIKSTGVATETVHQALSEVLAQ